MEKRIFWIGDSTVHFNRVDTWPQRGMGQELEAYLRPGVVVYDYAENGRSTKSFWDQGLFEPVREAMKAGDFLFIQFGHNDEKSEDPALYADPEAYQENLLRYVSIARAAGAFPVLITPLTRRRFEGGCLTESHGAYPAAVRALAEREGIPLIDLTAASRALVESLGDEESRELYMNFPAGLYPSHPDGSDDNTHLRQWGAFRFAGLVADGLKALGGIYTQLLYDPQRDKK